MFTVISLKLKNATFDLGVINQSTIHLLRAIMGLL